MSFNSQIMNMKTLYELLSQDLGYIFGERESGPNGAKKIFLAKGRAFLSAIGRDLGFDAQKVYTNKAGIAATSFAMASPLQTSNGSKFSRCGARRVSLWESEFPKVTALNNFCYVARSALLRKNSFCRRQKGREYVGHCNSRITPDELRETDYAGLLLRMLDVKGYGNDGAAA